MYDAQDRGTTDLIELLRSGPAGNNFVPEQERNFDAGYTPTPHEWKICKKEWINGKLYNVYS